MQELQEMKEDILEKEDYNYEPFADTEEYRQVNSECITSWVQIMKQKGIDSLESILDVATGAGTMVQLVFDNFPDSWKKAAVLCLDQSSGALKLAQSKLEQTVNKLKLVHSSIQDPQGGAEGRISRRETSQDARTRPQTSRVLDY